MIFKFAASAQQSRSGVKSRSNVFASQIRIGVKPIGKLDNLTLHLPFTRARGIMRHIFLVALTVSASWLMSLPRPAGAAVDCMLEQPLLSSNQAESDLEWLKRQTGDMYCTSILFRDSIDAGDYERFLSLLKRADLAAVEVYLTSPGGIASEALKIGRLLRQYLIAVRAPSRDQGVFVLNRAAADKVATTVCRGAGCVCASACSLLWFAGVDRMGTVGLHRPKLLNEIAALTMEDARRVYQSSVAEVTAFLREMEVADTTIERMLSTDSNEILWQEDVQRAHPLRFPPSTSEYAICGQVMKSSDRRSLNDLDRKLANFKRLPSDELQLRTMLLEEEAEQLRCRSDLLHRERLLLVRP